jgi:hypothetical protein
VCFLVHAYDCCQHLRQTSWATTRFALNSLSFLKSWIRIPTIPERRDAVSRASWLSGNNSNCILETVGLNTVTSSFGASATKLQKCIY